MPDRRTRCIARDLMFETFFNRITYMSWESESHIPNPVFYKNISQIQWHFARGSIISVTLLKGLCKRPAPSDYQASVGRDLLRKCKERKSVQTYPGLMASWSRAQREKGRPGVVLLSDSFEYLHPANPNPPCGPACIVRPGYFGRVILLYCAAALP